MKYLKNSLNDYAVIKAVKFRNSHSISNSEITTTKFRIY